MVLAYDGTSYAGWQIQPDRTTVQGVLEAALARLQGGDAVRVRGAGRTDAGVHALAQVADTELNVVLDDDGIAHALRGMLPDDVRPVAVETVAADFHSRKSARWKTYHYLLDRSEAGDALLARYALRYSGAFDEDAVRAALGRLPGRRDWSGFAGAACPPGDRVRELTLAEYRVLPASRAVFRFRADGFLNHMVRNLVGTLLEIGRGRFGPDRIDDVLDSGDRRRAGPTAAPHGLFLERIEYDGWIARGAGGLLAVGSLV